MTIDSMFAPIVKAYDIRGTVPDQLNERLARALGAAFAEEIAGEAAVVIGHDMRDSSPGLAAAFADGVRSMGIDVVMISLASTDMLYFASGSLNLPGVMVTASHNPAQYNGFKLCRASAVPIGWDTGLKRIAERAAAHLDSDANLTGAVSEISILHDYAQAMHDRVSMGSRKLRVVVDAANGMAGYTTPAVFATLNAELIEMYFELDGSFPNHEANPLEPENLRDLQSRVVNEEADIGLAFDGDADRCFVVDELGRAVSPSVITALIAQDMLRKHPGATVLYNAICSDVVPETIEASSGTAIRTPVGHSLIKATMASSQAIFGGEHSGHYYFADFYCADSGMLAALYVLAALSKFDGTLSEMVAPFEKYVSSPELNQRVSDQAGVIDSLAQYFSAEARDQLDGLTIRSKHWWFNVRASNTEPLLRLNVEAEDEETMTRVRDLVLGLIEKYEAERTP